MPGAPACGLLEQGRVSGPLLAVGSPESAVTPGFNLAGRCTHPTAEDRAIWLESGAHFASATQHCFLPNPGEGVCVPK